MTSSLEIQQMAEGILNRTAFEMTPPSERKVTHLGQEINTTNLLKGGIHEMGTSWALYVLAGDRHCSVAGPYKI